MTSRRGWIPQDPAAQRALQRAVEAKLREGPTGRLAPREEVNAARRKLGLPEMSLEAYEAEVARRRQAAGRQPIVFPPPRPAQTPPRLPYLVVRLMAAIYQREEIDIQVGEPCVEIGFRSSYVRHPEPLTDTGEISPGCRELLIRGVLSAVQNGRFRMCLVWARDACTFCERDGTTLHSNQPPSGGFGSGGVNGTPLPVNIRFDRDPEPGAANGGEGHA